MKTHFLCLGVAALTLVTGPSCSLIENQDITYDMPAQELHQSLSGTFTGLLGGAGAEAQRRDAAARRLRGQ